MVKPTNVNKPGINWKQVRERLRASEHALAEALIENPAQIETAYRRRAAQLAKSSARAEPRTATADALLFSLQQEHYAVELSELAEVLPLERCRPVPGAATAFLGVFNLRGEIRPLVDLGRMILRVENGTNARGFVLMLRRPGHEIGLRVDQVEGLRQIPSEKVGSCEPCKYTKRIAGETLLLLDVERVLAEVFSKEELLTA
jgi:chemotaxis signal transduction protein